MDKASRKDKLYKHNEDKNSDKKFSNQKSNK